MENEAHASDMLPSHRFPSKRLGLVPVRGDFPTEEVFHRTWRKNEFFVKRESPESPWEWIILDGRDPIEFGDGFTSFDEAERALAELVFEMCPDFIRDAGHLAVEPSGAGVLATDLAFKALGLVVEAGELALRKGRAMKARALVALRTVRDTYFPPLPR